MGNDTSVLADFTRTEWHSGRAAQLPRRPEPGRAQLLAILTDAAVIRIGLLAVGISALLLAIAAVL
jgi:hypothetical protein